MIRLKIVIIPLFFFSCQAKHVQLKTQTLAELAREQFKNNYSIHYNKSRTFAFVLSKKKTSSLYPTPVLEYFVYDVGKKKISKKVIELRDASVAWETDQVILISQVFREREAETRYNVLTGNSKFEYLTEDE